MDKLVAFERQRKDSERGSAVPPAGLICVTTQVIEAGVDVSARRIWMALAPWPSLIQRLGRLNRDGKLNGQAKAYFFKQPADAKIKPKDRIGPYLATDLQLAEKLADHLVKIYDAQPDLAAVEALARLTKNSATKELAGDALSVKPEPFPRALVVHGLFSTEPDVFGGFTDVGPFIRNSDPDADVTVFWREWKGKQRALSGDALAGPHFTADEGCQVPFWRLRDFLGDQRRAWVWSPKNADGEPAWEPVNPSSVCPGMVVMLPAAFGGYSQSVGWTGNRDHTLANLPLPGPFEEGYSHDQFSEKGWWVELGTHLDNVENVARQIASVLELPAPLAESIVTAGAFHDIGKALAPWQFALPQPLKDCLKLWAKAPYWLKVSGAAKQVKVQTLTEHLRTLCSGVGEVQQEASEDGIVTLRWLLSRPLTADEKERLTSFIGVQRASMVPFRPKLRHEAASALALWHRYFRAKTTDFPALVIYLAAAHHGKVRTVLASREADGQDVCGVPKSAQTLPWPAKDNPMALDFTCATDGAEGKFSEDGTGFFFESPGWTALVADLLGPCQETAETTASSAVPAGEPSKLGPFALAWLEVLVRAADERASAQPSHRLPP